MHSERCQTKEASNDWQYHQVIGAVQQLVSTSRGPRLTILNGVKWGHYKCLRTTETVDGRNPANQLRLVVYPMIIRVSYMSGGCLGFLPSTLFYTLRSWEGFSSKIPKIVCVYIYIL